MSKQREKALIACARCGRSLRSALTAAGRPRLPRGWKRHAGEVWCDQCWRAGWKLRAVTLPIAGPVGAEWSQLREALHACWASATRLANWQTTELYARDVRRGPGDEKMPPMKRCYLYPEARVLEPEMDPQSVAALLQATERKYRARRYDVIWRGAQSLPNHRYPVPYPVPNQGWSVRRGEDGERLLSVALGGTRWSIRLRGGARHRRQLKSVDALIAGGAVKGELAIYRKSAASSHRPGDGPATDVMVKMVMWLPKHRGGREGGTLHVRTGGRSLLIYHLDDQEPRYLHADQVRRWIAAYQHKLKRIADDTKREKRKPRRAMRGINQRRREWGRKHHRRLDSFAHEATAMLANYARRRGASRVVLDMSDQSFAASFPYIDMAAKLEYKLDAIGVVLERSSGPAAAQQPDSLEQENAQ